MGGGGIGLFSVCYALLGGGGLSVCLPLCPVLNDTWYLVLWAVGRGRRGGVIRPSNLPLSPVITATSCVILWPSAREMGGYLPGLCLRL